ncbi:hypothetical protein Tco_0694319 [Tanacetum coccineum]
MAPALLAVLVGTIDMLSAGPHKPLVGLGVLAHIDRWKIEKQSYCAHRKDLTRSLSCCLRDLCVGRRANGGKEVKQASRADIRHVYMLVDDVLSLYYECGGLETRVEVLEALDDVAAGFNLDQRKAKAGG